MIQCLRASLWIDSDDVFCTERWKATKEFQGAPLSFDTQGGRGSLTGLRLLPQYVLVAL